LQLGYGHAVAANGNGVVEAAEFIDWYCSEPRLALNRTLVLHYRSYLEARPLGRQPNEASYTASCQGKWHRQEHRLAPHFSLHAVKHPMIPCDWCAYLFSRQLRIRS
jgi:hypothetical protein